MAGDGCRAELFEERHRDGLRAACAEETEIWQIYANDFGPDGHIGDPTSATAEHGKALFEAAVDAFCGALGEIARFELPIRP